MNKECKIVRDLLPLYVENIASDETREFVEAHLLACPECRAEKERATGQAVFVADTDVAPLKRVRKELARKKKNLVISTAALILALMIAVISTLTSPQYLPWSDDLIGVSEGENGAVTLTFGEQVMGYSVFNSVNEALNVEEYCVQAWKSDWERYFARRPVPNFNIASAHRVSVVYSANDGSAERVIYRDKGLSEMALGEPGEGIGEFERIALPRLALKYYLIAASALALIAGGLWYALRGRERAGRVMEGIFFLPVSYIVAHFAVNGAKMTTYSMQHDLSLMALIFLCVYCAIMFGVRFWRGRKA